MNWETDIQEKKSIQLLDSASYQAVPNNLVTNANQQLSLNVPDSSLVDMDYERSLYVFIYTATMCLVLWLVVQRGVTFFYMCLRASRRLHDRLFRGIIHAPMFFFNTNSSGRIINRFSKDISGIDATLPLCLYESMFVSGL